MTSPPRYCSEKENFFDERNIEFKNKLSLMMNTKMSESDALTGSGTAPPSLSSGNRGVWWPKLARQTRRMSTTPRSMDACRMARPSSLSTAFSRYSCSSTTNDNNESVSLSVDCFSRDERPVISDYQWLWKMCTQLFQRILTNSKHRALLQGNNALRIIMFKCNVVGVKKTSNKPRLVF